MQSRKHIWLLNSLNCFLFKFNNKNSTLDYDLLEQEGKKRVQIHVYFTLEKEKSRHECMFLNYLVFLLVVGITCDGI